LGTPQSEPHPEKNQNARTEKLDVCNSSREGGTLNERTTEVAAGARWMASHVVHPSMLKVQEIVWCEKKGEKVEA
jgi:hypothetical protein